jgi:hypothetical protein
VTDVSELLLTEAYDEGVVTEVIRPAAILPEASARAVLVELAIHDVRSGGLWHAEPTMWRRYDRPWSNGAEPGDAQLLGTMQVAYGTPTKYEITIYRVTVTRLGSAQGSTVENLSDEALGFGGLTLLTCPRASLAEPPRPFRMPDTTESAFEYGRLSGYSAAAG